MNAREFFALMRKLIQESRGAPEHQAGAANDKALRELVMHEVHSAAIDSDAPCQSSRDDRLGFASLARDVARVIASPVTLSPYTFCIDGDWGTGKSSLSRMIHAELSTDSALLAGCLAIWIDTSLIDGPENVVSTFYQAIERSMRVLAMRMSMKPNAKEVARDGFSFLVPSFYSQAETGEILERKDVDLIRRGAEQWLRARPSQGSKGQSVADLKALIEEARYSLLPRGGLSRVVLFVDDLDRCKPDTVSRVLDVHRSQLESWGVYLVYSMNCRVVLEVVRSDILTKMGARANAQAGRIDFDDLSQASAYFDKFFLRRIRPPAPADSNIKSWLEALLPKDIASQPLLSFLRDAHESNARRLKRFAATLTFLLARFDACSDSGDLVWGGLIGLRDRLEARRVLTRVAAFALAEQYRGFYELARLPDPRHLITCEYRSAARAPMPRLAFDPKTRVFSHLESLAPSALVEFLRQEPVFANREEAVTSAILAVESVLPPSLIRTLEIAPIEPTTQNPQDGVAVPRRAAASDKLRVEQIVESWVEQSEKLFTLEPEVKRLLGTTAPDSLVSAFVDAQWEPDIEKLVLACAGDNEHNVAWTLCALAIHPSITTAQFLGLTGVAGTFQGRAVVLVALTGLSRFSMEPLVVAACARALIRVRAPEKIEMAVHGCLRILGFDVKLLGTAPTSLASMPLDTLIELVYGVTDGLGVLGRHREELEFMRAVLKTPMGRESSAIIRNYARAYERATGDAAGAQLRYDAAITKGQTDVQACVWAVSVASDWDEATQYLTAAFSRDPRDSTIAAEIGIRLHNRGRLEEATVWLDYAVVADPSSREARRALQQHYGRRFGLKESADVLRDDYSPNVDLDALKWIGREAHRKVLARIVQRGVIFVEEIVLFDPANLPHWIDEILRAPKSP